MGNSPIPPIPGEPPGFVSVDNVSNTEIDPKAFSQLWELGKDAANLIPKWVMQIFAVLIKCLTMGIGIWVGLIDLFLSALADFFQQAQGNSNPAFYNLVAALITDLTGVEVAGADIVGKFQQRGRLAAMQALGGALVDTLAGEFGGVFQTDRGGVFTAPKGTGIGGLPDVQLSPEQGVNAARAFMGFALSFAVREGNTDFFADSLPFGIGHCFKDFTEDLSKNLGLGRMVRLALKPLFQNLVAIPMTWAFNKQYRPTLLGASEAIRAFNNGLYTAEQLTEELARHGFSVERQNALQAFHTRYPNEQDLFLLELANKLPRNEHLNALLRTGYSADTAQQLIDAEPLRLQRHLSEQIAHSLLHSLLNGEIDADTYSAALNRFMFTADERNALAGFAAELLSHARKRATFTQMETMLVDGIIDVGELQSWLQTEGYSADDQLRLMQLALLKVKAAQAKAAKSKGTTTIPKP